MQRACYNKPVGYNATRGAGLFTVASIGPLDPSSKIALGSVSYYYCCLLWSTVCDRCNRHSSAVLLLCCPAAVLSCCYRHRQQQQSSSAIVAGSREGNSTCPAGVVVCLWWYTCIYVQRTLLLSLLCCGGSWYAVFSYEYIDPTISYAFTMHQVPGITYWCKKSFVRVQSFTYYAPYTYQKIKNTASGTTYYQACVLSNLRSWSGAFTTTKTYQKDIPGPTHHTYHTKYVDEK